MSNVTLTPTVTRNCRAKDPSKCRYHGSLANATRAQIEAADRAELENDYNNARTSEAFRARHHQEIGQIVRDLYPGTPAHHHVAAVQQAVTDVLSNIKTTGNVTNAEVETVTERLFPGEPLANHAVDVRAALQNVATPYVYKPGFIEMNALVATAVDGAKAPAGWSVVSHKVQRGTDKFNTIFMTVRNDVSDQYFTYTATDAHGYNIPRREANGNLKQVEKPADIN